MPVLLPPGASSLPPLGGRLLRWYIILWGALLAAAVTAALFSLVDSATHPLILALRTSKSIVLITVAAILFRRRRRDAVAAMLGLSFLLWTISSSADFLVDDRVWPILIDRLRFLLFALALLLFPDGDLQPRRTARMVMVIVSVFAIGAAEALGLLTTALYLPLAIGCVVMALGLLLARYRLQPLVTQQQLKWVTLGLVVGIGFILLARVGAAVALPMAGTMPGRALFEAMFQTGIIVIALGFLTSLLRYRLYDAEVAISRSAAYAGLTLALVAVFAASESLIETLGQRFFGPNVGDLSGGIAAAIAAVLLTPLHGKISSWAEARFQRDLNDLQTKLPDLLAALSHGASLTRFAASVLPRIGDAVHAARIGLVVDHRLIAVRGEPLAAARRSVRASLAAAEDEGPGHDADRLFPLRIALRCPFGEPRGWLLLGPRHDGSAHSRDELDALEAIAAPLQRAVSAVAERERSDAHRRQSRREMARRMKDLEARLAAVEGGIVTQDRNDVEWLGDRQCR